MTGPAPADEERAAVLEAEVARLRADLASLRESERMYRHSAVLAGRLVWVADAAGNMLFLDNPFVVLTGMNAEQGLGSGWLDVVHPGDRERVHAQWTQSVESGDFYDAEFRVLRAASAEIAESVRTGGSLSGALRKAGIFPPLLVYLAASGEASGKLDVMLERAADYLEREFDTFTTTALALLEPAIIIFMGVIVALILLSILLPILQLDTLAGGYR